MPPKTGGKPIGGWKLVRAKPPTIEQRARMARKIMSQPGFADSLANWMPLPMASAEAVDQCMPGDHGCDSYAETFESACAREGFNSGQIDKIAACWTKAGIPLTARTAPLFTGAQLVGGMADFDPRTQTSAEATQSKATFWVDGQERQYLVKCYAPPTVVMARQHNAGIDPYDQRREARQLLASLIHDHLGWNVVPRSRLGFIRGKACVVTEYVADAEMYDYGLVARRPDPLTPEAKEDLAKINFLAVLFGDVDRHEHNFLVEYEGGDRTRKISRYHGVDFDMSFPPGLTTEAQVLDPGFDAMPPTRIYTSFDVMKSFYDDVMTKLTPEAVAKLADGLLTDGELDALMSRLADLRTTLEIVRNQNAGFFDVVRDWLVG